MKKLMFVIVAAGLSFTAFAQGVTPGKQDKDQPGEQYCARVKDGKVIVMSGQKEIYNDITLANGTKIKSEGPVIEKKDGTTKSLKEGECVDAQGNIIKSKTQEKLKKEEEELTPNRY